MLKKIAVVLSAALVVCVIAGCGGSKAASVSKGSGGDAASSTANASVSASQPAADYSTMSIGDTVKLKNGLEITLNEVEVFTPQYSDKPATRALVTYANNGEKKASFNMFDWKAEDSNGAETSTTIVMGAENELHSGDLRSGGSVSGNIYFDGDDVAKIRYYSNIFQGDSDICWVLK